MKGDKKEYRRRSRQVEKDKGKGGELQGLAVRKGRKGAQEIKGFFLAKS